MHLIDMTGHVYSGPLGPAIGTRLNEVCYEPMVQIMLNLSLLLRDKLGYDRIKISHIS